MSTFKLPDGTLINPDNVFSCKVVRSHTKYYVRFTTISGVERTEPGGGTHREGAQGIVDSFVKHCAEGPPVAVDGSTLAWCGMCQEPYDRRLVACPKCSSGGVLL